LSALPPFTASVVVRPPYEPEDVETQRARYGSALMVVHDVESIRSGNAPDPGLFRRFVFDSRDGIRLVVSVEAVAGQGEYLHLSASLDPDCEHYADVGRGTLNIGSFMVMVMDRFRAISGDDRPLKFRGLSPLGVPHWCRPAWEVGEG
jgi:hypothetical protein